MLFLHLLPKKNMSALHCEPMDLQGGCEIISTLL